MTEFRLPGPICRVLGALDIDFGTLCRVASPTLGPVVRSTPQQPGKPSLKLLEVTTPNKGVATKLTEAAANSLGADISVAIIRAFAEVETGGKSGFGPDGLPIIAYEGHIFRKLTGHKFDNLHPNLSYKYVKKAGSVWRSNNKDQKVAWKTLSDAMALDHDAALQSCSWGMFQVMGFNYNACGYKNVDEFVAALKTAESGQLDAFVGYCKSAKGITAAMKNKNYVQMAMLYNGSDYGDYDKRIEKAYKKHGGT